MKQIIASVFSDIYTIGNIIFCIFKFKKYNCKYTLAGLPKLTSFLVLLKICVLGCASSVLKFNFFLH